MYITESELATIVLKYITTYRRDTEYYINHSTIESDIRLKRISGASLLALKTMLKNTLYVNTEHVINIKYVIKNVTFSTDLLSLDPNYLWNIGSFIVTVDYNAIGDVPVYSIHLSIEISTILKYVDYSYDVMQRLHELNNLVYTT